MERRGQVAPDYLVTVIFLGILALIVFGAFEHTERQAFTTIERIYAKDVADQLTKAINSSITGSIISGLESEKQTIQSTGSIQKTNLELEVKNLQNEMDKLESGLAFYKGIVDSLDGEKFQIITAPLRNRIEFQIKWDKYITVHKGQEYVWDISIENLDDITRTFSTSLKIKSNRDELFSRAPATGSLTLTPENSGNLEVKLVPESTGYAILEIYVNTHYVGDLVVFSV